MMAFTVVTLEFLACLGFGALILRGLGLLRQVPFRQRLPLSFAIGFGCLGWLTFWPALAGALQGEVLASVLGLGLVGLSALRGHVLIESNPPPPPATILTGLILAGLIAVAVLGLAGALAPPSDADTLAYHFAHPKEWLAAGKLLFVARMADGAAPFLIHMTYVPALKLGGEQALTLWVFVSGWGMLWLFWSIARDFVTRDWALALTLLLATIPAVVYGAGSGQVETRIAMFVMATALALSKAKGGKVVGWAALAGIAAGFFMGSKFLGLLFATALGLMFMLRRPGLKSLMAFGTMAVIAGFQWYGWNAYSSGDPLFPKLWGIAPIKEGLWNQAAQDHVQYLWPIIELPMPSSLWTWVSYPFVATLNGPPGIESSRTGFGPWPLMVLPFAVAGAWIGHKRLASSPLIWLAGVTALTYTLWIFIPSSQRVRHLLPLLPLLVICFGAATTYATRFIGLARLLAVGTAAALLVQMAGTGLYGMSFVKRLVRGESPDAFLGRTVDNMELAHFLNGHIGKGQRVLTMARTINYYLDVPYFSGHYSLQAQIDLRPEADDEKLFLRQTTQLGITHILVGETIVDSPSRMVRRLAGAGCARIEAETLSHGVGSRTLSGPQPVADPFMLYRLLPEACAGSHQ